MLKKILIALVSCSFVLVVGCAKKQDCNSQMPKVSVAKFQSGHSGKLGSK